MKNIRFVLLSILTALFIGNASAMPIYNYYFEADGIQYFTYSYNPYEAMVISCKDTTDIVIPDTVRYDNHTYKVTAVADGAFSRNSKLTTIDLGNVTSIGEGAFKDCITLRSVKMEQVTSIGEEAFRGCTALNSIKMEKVDTMGWQTFQDCTGLTTVSLGKLPTIPYRTFYSCTSLKSVDLGEVTTIGQDAFARCTSLVTIDLKNAQRIGGYAFERCTALKTIDLKQVKSIDMFTFAYCSELTSIDLGQVTTIPYLAFKNCTKLTDIDLRGVTTIEQEAFLNCSGLQSIDLKNVTKLVDKAFEGCSGLQKVNLGSLTSISNQTFKGCRSLKSINLENVTTIGEEGFRDCSELQTIDLSSVIVLKDYAFQGCSSLTALDLKNITTLPIAAFRDCASLTSVDLKNVTTLNPNVFYGCTGLTDIDFGVITTIPYQAFYGCTSLKTIDFKQVTTIDHHAFDSCTGLNIIDLNHVTTIGENAFADCKGLQRIRTHEKNPPVIAKNSFGDINYFRATLEVPVGCKSAYQNAAIWGLFSNIQDSIAVDSAPLTLICTESGQMIWGDQTFTNGEYTFEVSLGEPVTLHFVPDEGCQLETVMINGEDVTNQISSDGLKLMIHEPTTVQCTFRKAALILNDATDIYDKATDEWCEQVEYFRIFDNTDWQTLYLPFALIYTDWEQDFQIASINDTHQYDSNNDGIADSTVLEAFILSEGSHTEANVPYLIKANTIGEKVLHASNVLLKKAEADSIDCSSVHYRYVITGTYSGVSDEEMYRQHYYTLSDGYLQPVMEPTSLAGFRWYLSVESRDGNDSCPVQKIRLKVVDSNGNTTGIGLLDADNGNHNVWPANVYNIQGKQVKAGARGLENLPKGIYIVNGQKIVKH